jgi:hypothetical protein
MWIPLGSHQVKLYIFLVHGHSDVHDSKIRVIPKK